MDMGRGMGGGSDEMLMTLLAGQAAVDCEQLPIGGWEEVDSWKKVSCGWSCDKAVAKLQELTLLSTRLESLMARHQRETKILTAARTLQKLNTANKRYVVRNTALASPSDPQNVQTNHGELGAIREAD